MAVSIDLLLAAPGPDQCFSGAEPSRCPVAGGQQRYRRPGRAGADLTNNGLHPFLPGRIFTLELMQVRRHQTTGL